MNLEQAENIVAKLNSIPTCGKAYINGRPPEIIIACREKERTNLSTHPCTAMDASECPLKIREELITEVLS